MSYASTPPDSFGSGAGIATAGEVDIDILAERSRAETVASGAVVKMPDLVSAWTRKP